MTIPEALKELYVALGGSADDVANMSTNPELIAKIATIAGGGSELPEVTSADNGDVLTVVEGAWGKANANLAVNINKTTKGYEGGITNDDIVAAINAGKNVTLNYKGALYRFFDFSNSYYYFYSFTYDVSNRKYRLLCISLMEGASTTFTSEDFKILTTE